VNHYTRNISYWCVWLACAVFTEPHDKEMHESETGIQRHQEPIPRCTAM